MSVDIEYDDFFNDPSGDDENEQAKHFYPNANSNEKPSNSSVKSRCSSHQGSTDDSRHGRVSVDVFSSTHSNLSISDVFASPKEHRKKKKKKKKKKLKDGDLNDSWRSHSEQTSGEKDDNMRIYVDLYGHQTKHSQDNTGISGELMNHKHKKKKKHKGRSCHEDRVETNEQTSSPPQHQGKDIKRSQMKKKRAKRKHSKGNDSSGRSSPYQDYCGALEQIEPQPHRPPEKKKKKKRKVEERQQLTINTERVNICASPGVDELSKKGSLKTEQDESHPTSNMSHSNSKDMTCCQGDGAQSDSEQELSFDLDRRGPVSNATFNYYTESSHGKLQNTMDRQTSNKPLKTGRFSKAEDEQLKKNWAQYLKENDFSICDDPLALLYTTMAESKDLRVQIKNFKRQTQFFSCLAENLQRSEMSVYCRARLLFTPASSTSNTKMDEDVEDQVVELLEKEGPRYSQIAREVGRTTASVQWIARKEARKQPQKRSRRIRHRWTNESEAQLVEAIRQQVDFDPEDKSLRYKEELYRHVAWSRVAKCVDKMDANQCRMKWLYASKVPKKPSKSERSRLRKAIFVRVSKLDVKDIEDINWLELLKDFPSVPSPQYLQMAFKANLKKVLPDYKMRSQEEIFQALRDEKLVERKLRLIHRPNLV